MGNGIANARNTQVLLKKGGNTSDIIEAVLDTVGEVREQTKDFSRQFQPDVPGLKKLWWWVKSEIHYNEDPLGVQWVREPARLYHDREGDCKSFTVFIVSVLENLKVPYLIRFVNTDRPGKKVVNHVYPVALLNGREVPIDAVYEEFNREHPYYYKTDYSMSDIYRLAGIGATTSEIDAYNQQLQAIAASIPDDVLVNDITQMTRGEYARFMSGANFDALASSATDASTAARYAASADAIRAGSIAGIGNLGKDKNKLQAFLDQTAQQREKAFQAPMVVIPEGVGKLGDKIKNVLENIKDAWVKVVNWLFKAALPIAAPYFLYCFIKSKVGKKTEAKKAKQMKLMNWVQKAGKFDTPDAVLASVKVGISKIFGKPVEGVLQDMANGKKVSGIGVLPALVPIITKALPIILELVKKIAGLFKKKDAPEVSAAYAPDANELMAELQENEKQSITTGSPKQGGEMGYTPLILGGAALGLFILLKT